MTKTQPSRPTEDFIDFLGRKYAGRQINVLESQLVAETWAMAMATRKAGPPTIEEIAATHVTFTDPLLDRVLFVRGVISDTLKKMSGEVPPGLRWAVDGRRGLRIAGIFRTNGHRGTDEDITGAIRSGKTAVRQTDTVRVGTTRGSYGSTMVTANLILADLSSSPTVVAQATRKACKAHTENLAGEEYAAAKRNQVALAEQIAALQAELAALDETLASTDAKRQARADEIAARARAVFEERSVERAARHAAKLAEVEGIA
jgi:hypothetical protein